MPRLREPQDEDDAQPETLSPRKGRRVQGVLGDASNREPSLSPTRRKRKKTEVRASRRHSSS